MKYMRVLVVFMVLILIGGAFNFSPTSCVSCSQSAAEGQETETVAYDLTAGSEDNFVGIEESVEETASNKYHWEPPVIPSFVKRLIPDADWSADTICVVDGKAYYIAYAGNSQTSVIYSREGILVADPTLSILPYDKARKLFHVSITGKDVLVDFSNSKSLQKLSVLSPSPQGFTTFTHSAVADYCEQVRYNIRVDFPQREALHSDAITKWLVGKIDESECMDGELPPLNAIFINHAKRTSTGWRYEGDMHNYQQICKFAADVYFAIAKGDYVLNEIEVPSPLFSTLCLKAYFMSNRFVTYQQYTHGYYGGAHGYYTERLISYNHVHGQEIDYKYLFKDECMEDILTLLKEEARKSPNYREWKPDIDEYAHIKDENDKPTGMLRLPQPGLSEEGVVFSFQPYAISCFAAGTFHFTIPYERLRPYLTDKAKWSLNMN